VGVCALALIGIGAGPVHAAWDNVFQACCNSCRGSSAVSAFGPSACCPQPCCPQPVCTTQYVQRCFYQPVTCYQTKTYYEPVTTYRTSYYYETVCSYRYSCCFDPCTCCYQQVATPVTSLRLRSQCCPVQSWVQRCCRVPVTTYQQSFYWEPVTTCCQPACCPQPCCPTPCSNGGTPAVAAPAVPAVPQQQPTVTEPQGSTNYYQPTPRVTEPAPSATGEPPLNQSHKPQTGTNSYRPPAAPARPATLPPPAVKLDRIVALPGGSGSVQGQVVRDDRSPRANAQVLFVCASQKGPRQVVTADATGRFQVTLASGGWLVYVHGVDGKPVFHSKIDVQGEETRNVTLVSR
jgi:hypothetical protein